MGGFTQCDIEVELLSLTIDKYENSTESLIQLSECFYYWMLIWFTIRLLPLLGRVMIALSCDCRVLGDCMQ